MRKLIIHSPCEDFTLKLGRLFASCLQQGDVVALWGDLGAGKTLFTGAVARGLGISKKIPITSPTFTIINEYEARLHLYHLDLYRIVHPDELETLPWREALFGSGVALIEWPERLGDALPACRWDVTIEVTEERERTIVIQALGDTFQQRLRRFYEQNQHQLTGGPIGSD